MISRGESVFAARAQVGERYLTKAGWPVLVEEVTATCVRVENDLTGDHHQMTPETLLWPYLAENISMEAMQMAKAQGLKKKKKAPAEKKPKAERRARVSGGPRPAAGTKMTRTYDGKDHVVETTAEGYRYDGQDYKSLTAVAKKITGYPSISGPAFFKTQGAPKEPTATAA